MDPTTWSTLERYIASMLLAGVGDAMGFKNGRWEFCMSGPDIHKEFKKLGGIEKLHIKLPSWRVSDDTVMQLATGDGLVAQGRSDDKESLYLKIAGFYKECMNDMQARSAGLTSRGHAYALQPQRPKGYQQPFNPRGGGCGAAMRAMCIGLRYPREEDLDDLISCSVESGRMTHHHPTAYLGAVAAALFTAYSIQGKPPREWGKGLMEVVDRAKEYVKAQEREVKENMLSWSYFTDRWNEYLKKRGIKDGNSDPVFPEKYGVKERDEYYKYVSFQGWGGASGHDAPMIAYDALLGSGYSWEEACKRGVLHGGDNDSTGTIVGACFGAMYGFHGVPEKNYKDLEYRDRLIEMAVDLFKLAFPEETVDEHVLDHLPISLPVNCVSHCIAEEASESSAEDKQTLAQDTSDNNADLTHAAPDTDENTNKDTVSTENVDVKTSTDAENTTSDENAAADAMAKENVTSDEVSTENDN